MIYRRRPWSSVWHFREDCHQWPATLRLFKEQDRLNAPTYGTLCDHCQAIQKRERAKAKYGG